MDLTLVVMTLVKVVVISSNMIMLLVVQLGVTHFTIHQSLYVEHTAPTQTSLTILDLIMHYLD
jgi:hypothetical protein